MLWPRGWNDELARDIIRIRYEHILEQIQSVNENVFRFLAIYQTLISALAAGQILLFINHQRWALTLSTTRIGLVGILVLETIVGVFASLMIIVGALNWFDYRSEECDISDVVLGRSFRKRPSLSNWYRWYETYIVIFIVLSVATLWTMVIAWMIPEL
jgi:magnesium-transporting ATPase (P-type)